MTAHDRNSKFRLATGVFCRFVRSVCRISGAWRTVGGCVAVGRLLRVSMLVAACWLLGARAEADLWRIEAGCLATEGGWVAVSQGFAELACEESLGSPSSELPYQPPWNSSDATQIWLSAYLLPGGGGGVASTKASSGDGGVPSALAPVACERAENRLVVRLPGEGNPAFDNPAPWTPLQPPRFVAS